MPKYYSMSAYTHFAIFIIWRRRSWRQVRDMGNKDPEFQEILIEATQAKQSPLVDFGIFI